MHSETIEVAIDKGHGEFGHFWFFILFGLQYDLQVTEETSKKVEHRQVAHECILEEH